MRGVTDPYTRDEADRRFAHVDTNGVIDGTGGIQFGNETLSVYDEGAWTPVLTFGGGSTGIAYASQLGYFVRFGPLVFWQAIVILSAKGSSTGAAVIGGLPVAALVNVPAELVVDGMTGLHGRVCALVVGGQTYINLYDSTTTLHYLDNTDFTNTSSFWMSGHYRVQ